MSDRERQTGERRLARRELLTAASALAVAAGCSSRDREGQISVKRASEPSAQMPSTTSLATTTTAMPEVVMPPSESVPETAATTPPQIEASSVVEEIAGRLAGREPLVWGLNVGSMVTSYSSGEPSLALTFDACGGPQGSGYDAELINMLIAFSIPATLFLCGRWIDANQAVARTLISNPLFEIGNHGHDHRPLSANGRSAYGIAGTASVRDALIEVAANDVTLRQLGVRSPRWFRSGTAYADDVCLAGLKLMGYDFVGFTTNADAGATASAAQIRSQLIASGPGSIVLSHMNHPTKSTFEGFSQTLGELLAKRTKFVRLSEVADRLVLAHP